MSVDLVVDVAVDGQRPVLAADDGGVEAGVDAVEVVVSVWNGVMPGVTCLSRPRQRRRRVGGLGNAMSLRRARYLPITGRYRPSRPRPRRAPRR